MTESSPTRAAGGCPPRRGVRAHPNYREPSSLPGELRRTGVPTHVRDWVGRTLHTTVVRARRLPGASSTAVHLLSLGDGRKVVLRRYAWPGFLENEPIAPAREVDVLDVAARHGLPVPRIIAADTTGDDLADGVPTIVMERIPGRASADPDVRQLAELAATIHDVDAADLHHRYFRWFDAMEHDAPRNARDPELWDWAGSLRSRPVPSYRPVLIHRDYHPGNVLWLRGRASGVVDWANGCRGPAACDVATCRRNLMAMCGVPAADAFAAAYAATTGVEPDPYWEVISVLEHGPSPWTNDQIARAELRLRRARGELGA